MNQTAKNLTTPEPIVQLEPGINRAAKSCVGEANILNKRIGSTLYKVNIHFSEGGRETLKEKALRLMKNDLNFSHKNSNMEPLQAGWLPRRSSL